MATSFPPYCDVFAENFKSSEDMKKELLTKTWDGVVDFKFPARISGGTYRKAQSAWFKKYTWMRYSASTDGVYCAPCFLFGSRESRAKVLSNTPLTDWCNFSKVVEHHVKSQHHEDQLIAAENYLAVASGESKDIECSLVSHYNATVEKNRKILTAIVETIILCGKQNLALRGHDDSTSNFQALLHFQAKYNDILNVHLSTCCPRTRYTSPAIQNTLNGICGQLITADLVEDCNQSGAFGFIADEATDAATMEQMALCVRFVDVPSSQIREEFLGFSTTDSTTGEALANAFLENLNNLAPDFQILLAVMPVSTATAERSFSVMRRVKTYLRSTMGTERLSGLGLLNVYREKQLNAERVVDIFANMQNRRMALLFKE